MEIIKQTLRNRLKVLLKTRRFNTGKRDAMFCRLCGSNFADYKLPPTEFSELVSLRNGIYICPNCLVSMHSDQVTIMSEASIDMLKYVSRKLDETADDVHDLLTHNSLHDLAIIIRKLTR